jgi:hypothetical protein
MSLISSALYYVLLLLDQPEYFELTRNFGQIPYIIAEAPSNLFVKGMLTSKWQSRIMIAWEAVLCCHAGVINK